MITLEKFMKTVDYRISDSHKYLWSCYGPNARGMSAYNSSGPKANTVCIVFDTESQVAYEMSAWDYSNEREYRWIHPDYLTAYKEESENRGIKFQSSIDDRKFIDLETPEDMLIKARAIFLGEDYDTRVEVPLNLSKDELFEIMNAAHGADMSLNKFVEKILVEEILRKK